MWVGTFSPKAGDFLSGHATEPQKGTKHGGRIEIQTMQAEDWTISFDWPFSWPAYRPCSWTSAQRAGLGPALAIGFRHDVRQFEHLLLQILDFQGYQQIFPTRH